MIFGGGRRSQLGAHFTVGSLGPSPPVRLHVEKWIRGAWVVTGLCPSMQAAERHTAIIGGRCRAVTARSGKVVAEWNC